jgi:HEAT repeat protein
MSTITNTHSRGMIGRMLHILVWCALLAGATSGQEKPRQSEKPTYAADKASVAAAMAAVKSGDFAPIDVEIIARADAVEAIPVLKDQFARVRDPLLKAKIASTLVRLGDKGDAYWDYLVKLATSVIEAPDFWSYDSQGKLVPGPSPEFIVWVKAHKLSPAEMGEWPQYSIPGPVMLLGLTGDPRAVPLLRRGLLSPNHMVETFAAKGLAEIGDEGSVPFMIEACKRAPPDAATAIAMSLVYFDDPRAQEAVDKYLPKEAAKLERENRVRGRKPFGD